MAWAVSSTAATICRYRAAGLPLTDLHTPVLGVSSRAVLPPENTAQLSTTKQCADRTAVGVSQLMDWKEKLVAFWPHKTIKIKQHLAYIFT